MCVDVIQYTVCNHKSRRFLKKCRFVRNVGCFEPVYAFLFGPRGKNPCTFPKVPGQVDLIEGWCSRMCQLKHERLNPKNFRGRSPCEYLRDQVEEDARQSGLPWDRGDMGMLMEARRMGRSVKEEWARREAEANRLFQSPYSERGYDRGYGGLGEERERGWEDFTAKPRSAACGDSHRTFGAAASAREAGRSLDWSVRERPGTLPAANQSGGYRSDGDTAGKSWAGRSHDTNLPARGRKSEQGNRKPEADPPRAAAPGPSRREGDGNRANVRAADLLRDGRHVYLAGDPANQPPPPHEQSMERLSEGGKGGKGGAEAAHIQGKWKNKISMLPRASKKK